MSVISIYIAYAMLAMIAFAVLPLRPALLASYIVGWLVLPVGTYPIELSGFTVEVIGGALPMPGMLVAKAWVVPVTTLVLAAGFGWRPLTKWRLHPVDLPMALWCAWPLLGGWVDSSPTPITATAYLLGTWGAPWLIGRIFLADEAGRAAVLDAIASGALLLVPAALAEGILGPFLYQALYGTHPFVDDGASRYLGYRPLVFFENGNQYGIVMALSAVAAVVAWWLRPHRWSAVRATLVVGIALLSQSIGAIMLMLGGLALLWLRPRRRLIVRLGLAVALFSGVAAPLYVSGSLPIEAVIRGTAPGQSLLAAVRATGRGAFAWRVSQDQKVAPLVRRHPITGAGRWDWWRDAGTRPWGLALLILGEFGLIGLALAATALLLPAGAQAFGRLAQYSGTAIVLALLTALAGIDALLNAFVFLPALVAAGAIAATNRQDRQTAPHMIINVETPFR